MQRCTEEDLVRELKKIDDLGEYEIDYYLEPTKDSKKVRLTIDQTEKHLITECYFIQVKYPPDPTRHNEPNPEKREELWAWQKKMLSSNPYMEAINLYIKDDGVFLQETNKVMVRFKQAENTKQLAKKLLIKIRQKFNVRDAF